MDRADSISGRSGGSGGILKKIFEVWSVKLMIIQTTYTQARTQFAHLYDSVVNDREIVIIRRRGAEDVALIAADELAGLLETAHLLKSPVNAERLLNALARARERIGTPQTIAELRREVGLDETGLADES